MPHAYIRWTPEHIAFVRNNVDKLPVREIARQLGRTVGSVRTFATKQGIIVKRHEKRKWTKAEFNRLMDLLETHPTREVCVILNRSYASIRSMMVKHHFHAFGGMLSLTEACRRTGYHRRQLVRARDALGQEWIKSSYSWFHRQVITEKQLEKLCNWLKDEQHPEPKPNEERFFKHVVKTNDGCWLWTGPRQFSAVQDNGYRRRRFDLPRVQYRPSRYAWLLTNGDPGNRGIYSKCSQHLPGVCIAPDHHFIGARGDETRHRRNEIAREKLKERRRLEKYGFLEKKKPRKRKYKKRRVAQPGKRICMGCRGSEVRILSRRLDNESANADDQM